MRRCAPLIGKAAGLVRAHTVRMSLIGALILFSVALASFGVGVSLHGSACVVTLPGSTPGVLRH